MSTRNTLRFALLAVPLLLAQGCATVMPETNARWSAEPHTKKVMEALEGYKQANGDYPFRLSDLQPHYLNARVPFAERDGKDVVWALYYKHLPPGTYEMLYEDASSDVVYRNGEVVSARRNPLRRKLDLPQ
jgi:hypothetical protein